MGLFERHLSLWVALCILSGIALGTLLPGVFQIFADLEYASVNLPIAVLIWLMIYPMMVQVDFAAIRDVGKRPKGLMLTLVVNWLIKPFTMAGLGWLFFRVRQLEARVEQLSSQQTNVADFKASVDSELTAVKADISWLSEDCFKSPRPVKL